MRLAVAVAVAILTSTTSASAFKCTPPDPGRTYSAESAYHTLGPGVVASSRDKVRPLFPAVLLIILACAWPEQRTVGTLVFGGAPDESVKQQPANDTDELQSLTDTDGQPFGSRYASPR